MKEMAAANAEEGKKLAEDRKGPFLVGKFRVCGRVVIIQVQLT